MFTLCSVWTMVHPRYRRAIIITIIMIIPVILILISAISSSREAAVGEYGETPPSICEGGGSDA